MFSSVSTIFSEIIEEVNALQTSLAEKCSLQEGIGITDTTQRDAARLRSLLWQLKGFYGETSPIPVSVDQKIIIGKVINDFSQAITEIFELPPPDRAIRP